MVTQSHGMPRPEVKKAPIQSKGRCWMLFLAIGGILSSWAYPADLSQERLKEQAFWTLAHGLFDRTLAYAERYLRQFPHTRAAAEVQLAQAQALYFSKEPREALRVLSRPRGEVPAELRSQWSWWQLQSLAACGKWDEAEQLAQGVLAKVASEEEKQKWSYALAWIFWQQGKKEQAKEALQKLALGSSGWSKKALLDLGRIEIEDGEKELARSRFERLAQTAPGNNPVHEAWFWLGELDRDAGKLEQAIQWQKKFLEEATPAERQFRLAAAYSLGKSLLAVGEPEKAMDFLEGILFHTPGIRASSLGWALAELYVQTARESATVAMRWGRWEEVLPQLDADGRVWIDWLRLRLAMEDPKLAAFLGPKRQALLGWQRIVEEGLPPFWKAFGYYQLAMEWLKQGEADRALEALGQAQELASPALAGYPHFVMGEILFAKGVYGRAAEHYREAAIEDPRLGEKATFNWLVSLARGGKVEEFEKGYQIFVRRYPSSQLLEPLVCERAELYRRLGKDALAEQAFREGLALPGLGKNHPGLLLALGDLLFENRHYREARACYQEVAQAVKGGAQKEEALYKVILSAYWSGELDARQARDSLLSWVSTHSHHSMAPIALFQAGELSLLVQDLVGAEAAFGKLAVEYPQHELADASLYWAARASLARGDGSNALALLEKIPEGSSWKAQARLLQARVYQNAGQYRVAADLLHNLLQQAKVDNAVMAEARMAEGECLFALGDYNKAAILFSQAAQSSFLASVRREEALYKEAMALDKEGRKEEALELFLALLEGKVGESEAKSFFWRVKAGLEAASLRLAAKDWEGAIAVYEALEELGGPTREEFHRTVMTLRREHFVLPQK
ncbi:tetratricopeptide repeat protein [Candidatus Methylacidithermus pantelleriae]|uniref:Tetratricopeptide repeat protein n=1 Tax=Candidatus Methylacidithermus pantelleriae TaxID=2744239 RepID=A0A8J2BMG6_9BACT|nr:tetratricopeptide repeat protein [Candidatus Methylacidithermus pantelleriae]CAF0689667.1 hypothetical protein MPNT_10307 [Candidatus Methylacidithermus pantelleriae]